MIDIEKLKALAEAATPSKWSVSGSYIATTREESGTTYVESWRSIALVSHDADREYIAAANPAALLELIAEVERLRGGNADLRTANKSLRGSCEAVGKEFKQAKRERNAARLQRDLQQDLAQKRGEERDQLKAENERLQRFETAYKEFSDKTDWVRPNAAAHELGMHVADVIRKRCDDLTSHNQAQADEIVRLRAIETFEDAVACVFDNLKYSAANTDDKAWDERLEDLAEDVIEYAPRYKKQWKDIIKLSRDKDSLQAENDALRKDAGRYRWLQRQVENCEWMAGTSTIADKFGSVSEERVSGAEDLDQTIDTAMAQEQQP